MMLKTIQGAYKEFESLAENQVRMKGLSTVTTIDRSIAPLLRTMNEHGIKTNESCGGHLECESGGGFPFISLNDEVKAQKLADLLEQHRDELNYNWTSGERHGASPSERSVIEPPMSINPTADSPSQVTREVANRLAYDYTVIQKLVKDNFKSARRTYPPNIPDNVIIALDEFTDEELEGLWAFHDDETDEFLGIGFFDEQTGKATKYTNPEKAIAIATLDCQYKAEQGAMTRQVWLDIVDSILMRWECKGGK